jgi:hypothetical protein
MVGNELFGVLLAHTVKGVESTLEVTFEGFASLSHLLHDFHTLFVGDTRAKGESGKIAANANTGRHNHGGFLTFKSGSDKAFGVHVGDVLGIGSVTVVVLHDLVKELVEGSVRVVGTSVTANAGVDVLATGKDALLERDTSGILLVLVQFPVFLGEETGNSGLRVVSREARHVAKIFGFLQPGTAVGHTFNGNGHFNGGATSGGIGVRATHVK